MREGDARKPRVGKSDIIVVLLARLLSKMWAVWIVGTILALCVVVYAIAWSLKRT
jgi:uncharacterized membrane protein YecN with MAPEG domain